MKVVVSYSGGKDSQASLIWAVKKYGVKNVEAVFCDTGWEHPITYQHIEDTTFQLGVKLVTVRSEKYKGMIDLAERKKRFPSTRARFCTSELKTIPFIDFVLEQKDHLIIVQGIRALESNLRSAMKKQCRFFKYYFEPYNVSGKTHYYRKSEIKEWVKKFTDDVIRPVFDWNGQQVIDYIKENGQEPNELYKQGFKRVGCFPCIMSRHKEVHEIYKRYTYRIDEIISHEKRIGSCFFKTDSIPEYARTGICTRTGKKYTTCEDLILYLDRKNGTIDMFEKEEISCSSYYHLCE